MQLAKSSRKPQSFLSKMLLVSVIVFIVALLVIFIQNFKNSPEQIEVRKQINIK